MWYPGPVAIEFTLRGPEDFSQVAGADYADGKPCALLDYAAGIEDTLDGCHGFSFTYLPVVFEDDCQIAEITLLRCLSTVDKNLAGGHGECGALCMKTYRHLRRDHEEAMAGKVRF